MPDDENVEDHDEAETPTSRHKGFIVVFNAAFSLM
jgi:hypothetical protein